jgi:hypothetical protein
MTMKTECSSGALTLSLLLLTILAPRDSLSAVRKLEDPQSGLSDNFNLQKQQLLINSASVNSGNRNNIAVLYDSSGIDKEFQDELLKSVFVALRELDEEDLRPQFLDLSKIQASLASEWILQNRTVSIVSLLGTESLSSFIATYDMVLLSSASDFPPDLQIFTPRLLQRTEFPTKVAVLKVYSLQMSPRALSTALLNRVEKVGIRTLIPVLDSNSDFQLSFLQQFVGVGEVRLKPIHFTRPIFIDDPNHLASFKAILNEYGNGVSEQKLREHSSQDQSTPSSSVFFNSSSIGVIMLAAEGSQKAMQVAAEKKHMQMGWFSPNILQHEEWAYRASDNDTNNIDESLNDVKSFGNSSSSSPSADVEINPHFGLYSVSYVGSQGWDNPQRRRVLRELTSYAGESYVIFICIR